MLGRALLISLVALLPSSSGCGPGGGKGVPETPAERGRKVYQLSCIACHNPDPSLPGSVGPPIKGSPRALVEARVLHAAYPPGYTPKRQSHIMPAQPHLASHIDELTAFLNAP